MIWRNYVTVTLCIGLKAVRQMNLWVSVQQIFSRSLFYSKDSVKTRIAVADKPAARRAASRRTFFQKIRWTLSMKTCERTKLTTLRVESRQFAATAPIFNLTDLHLASPLGVTPFEFFQDFWHKKTRVPGLSCSVVCVIIRLAVSVEHQLVKDRRTDGRTDGHTTTANTRAGKNQETSVVWKFVRILHGWR